MKVQISLFFKAFLVALILVFSSMQTTKAQTTLVAGDLVFTGYIGRETSPANDAFSFVLLKAVVQNTTIRFTDYGWRTASSSFNSGGSTETEAVLTITALAGLPAGTEIKISNTTATLVGGGSAGSLAFTTGTAPDGSTFLSSNFSLNGINGDQVLAYQGTIASPIFIAGIHWNVYKTPGDASTTTDATWDGTASGNNASTSEKPTSLTAGTNALWIYSLAVADALDPEKGNGHLVCGSLDLSTASLVRAAVCNRTNWEVNDLDAPAIGFALPTGCSYITAVPAPAFTTNPSNSSICENANTSFTIVATGATTYQWQVNDGSGFVNLNNDPIYSNVTTTTLNITAAPNSLNSYLYRCVATNGTGPTNSNSATLTITPLPTNPTLLVKTPNSNTVADGTLVSATFTAGSGGTGCTDDYRYTTNGGATYLTYAPGATIATTGLAATSGSVTIEGRRANCSGTCQNLYVPIASWLLTPLPATATTLVAGDIAFSGYNSGTAADDFSFVLLRNIGPGTVLNFTNNGWLSTNAFSTGEETITWTAPAGGLSAGTEIKIAGTTATKSSGGSAGTVTGTPFSLSINGDQILAYTGTTVSPTFISAIHMNVYSTTNSDPVTTTAATWDGTNISVNASALPTGLTTGVNAIWIGTQGVIASEFDNAKYGNCANPAVLGPIGTLRASLNNQSNWTKNDGATGFTLPTACNYLNILTPSITILDTPLVVFNACIGTASAEQSFKVSGDLLTANILITAPTGFEVSTTSGSGFAGTVTLTQTSGVVNTTTVYTRVTATATGTPAGNITVASAGVSIINIGATATLSAVPTTAIAGSNQTLCATTATLAGNAPTSGTGMWSITTGAGGIITTPTSPTSAFDGAAGTTYTLRWTISNGGCTASSSDVTIAFDAPPTPSNAGLDKSLCGVTSTSLPANNPSVGTGLWTIFSGTGGSFTANTQSNTNFTGVLGNSYTLVWTISNGICASSSDTVVITFNVGVPAFNVTGGGVFCQSIVDTLKGPIDPNYTYAWERSLTGIASPNSFTAFGGTSQNQAVSASGVYRLNVTNQFGCIASDTASIAIADYVFNGSLAAGDAQQTGRMNRFATVSTCAAPKSYPGTFATSGARFYDTYTITNPRAVPVCATIGLASNCSSNIFSAAYLGSFNPADITANYLADHGSSFPNTAFYEATIPANGTIVIVVHERDVNIGCIGYQLTVDVPRDASPITSVAAGASYNLTAPVATSYLWSPGGGTTQTVSTAMLPGNKFFVTTGYGNAGCTKLDSITFATILNVNTSTYFVTIQNAIDAATDGDTIQIPANTYLENLVVNKNISFKFTSNNDVTISSITVDATMELKHNLSFNTTTFTNNGIYTSKGFVGKLINNGTVAPKQP